MGRRVRPKGLLGYIFGVQADYVRNLAPLFLLCFIGFCFSMFLGFYLGDSIPTSILEEFIGSLPDLEKFDVIMFFLFIVYHNVSKTLLWMVLGIIGSFPPLFFSVLNGFFLGHVSYVFSLEYSLPLTMAALIPHGIIEFPTILLSSAAGMALGYALLNRLRGRGSIRVEIARAFRLYVTRIVPLLVIAAIIEVTITPLIIVFFGFP
jgi:stage II sporulation protein M